MISLLFELGANLFDAIIAIYFLTKFNYASFRKNYFAIPAFIAILGFAFVGDYLFPGFTLLPMIALFIFTSCYALLISRKHYIRAIFSACIFVVSYMLISSLLYMIISMFVQDFDLIIQSSNSGSISRYIYIILGKLSLFMVLKLFLVIFRKNNISVITSGILTFLFTLITLLGLGATMVLTALPNAQKIQNQILLIVLAFIAANILLYILLWQVQKLQQHKYELMLLEKRMEAQEAHYKEISTIYANARKIQHDIMKHLTVVSYYLKENNLVDGKKYLQEVLTQVESNHPSFHSGNTVLDCLLQAKMDTLKNIQLKIAGYAGDFSDIKETDLTCLIGNVLDNAIEGVANISEKRIELYFNQKNNARIIICQNTVNHSVLESNPELQTTKSSKEEHGLGHKIIAKIVNDYNGILEYFEENGMFGVQIILPKPPM